MHCTHQAVMSKIHTCIPYQAVLSTMHTHTHMHTPDQAVISMMDEMDLIKKWKIPRKTIAR